MRHDLRLIALIAAALTAAAAHAQLCPPALLPACDTHAQETRGPSPAWTVSHRSAAPLTGPDLDRDAISFCFAPDTDPAVVAAHNVAMDALAPRANPNDRWNTTASGSTGAHGTPITLTYSFVPDGTSIPESSWTDGGSSSLHAFFDGIYGTPDVWQSLFGQAFQRWSDLTGISFVHEPNDDGVPLSSSNRGVLGVRGDIRISAGPIDGNSNVLAYNYYPDYGDMVIDAGDSWYNTTTGNSRGLRNLVTHEVGHGIGLAHVCPVQRTKIMEPYITTVFDGPQHDDLRGVHHLYGDAFEPDDSAMQAVDLGALAVGTTVVGTPPPPAVRHGADRGIDADGDEDWLSFTLDAQSHVSLILTPYGTLYDDSDQDCSDASADCCSGNVVNSRTAQDLAVRLINADSGTLIAEAAGADPGLIENLPDVLLDAGAYHVRVTGTGGSGDPQLYALTLDRRLYIPPVCPCETDGNDTAVDVFDLLAYLDDWFAMAPAAELTGDVPADIDVFDLLRFLDCWFQASAGTPCP